MPGPALFAVAVRIQNAIRLIDVVSQPQRIAVPLVESIKRGQNGEIKVQAVAATKDRLAVPRELIDKPDAGTEVGRWSTALLIVK